MTSAAPEPPFSIPPPWPRCGHGATSADPVGCRGIHVGGHTACLAHLNETDRTAYLATLSPGTGIDHRGTPFTPELLDRLLTALRDPTTGKPHIGIARFDEVSFSGTAWFGGVSFSGPAGFSGASFSGPAEFVRASFSDTARFDEVSFSGTAWFDEVSFFGTALFGGASFFGIARFGGASFSGAALFGGASFSGDTRFYGARFEVASSLGPLVCGQRVVLDAAVFGQPVAMEIAARQVSCARTRWASTATLHLRYAELDLRDAVFEYPVVVAARPDPFPLPFPGTGRSLPETLLSGLEPGVRLSTVGGVDAAHLALHDVDLSGCRFAGAVHLDQLKVDGWCTFAATPTGWSRRFPWRWSRRTTLVEEHHWRVRTARHPALARGWTDPPQDAPALKPAAVAALYRQVRKSLEDGKNEPDAADFYYGECGAA